METVFLVCFSFGALFTVVSVLLGAMHSVIHFGHGSADGHGALHTAHGDGAVHAHHAGDPSHLGDRGSFSLPLFNVSAWLAFLTWFGAAGFLLLRFAEWPPALAVGAAALAGLAGWLLIGFYINRVLAGERVMDPADYRLEGTLGRVTVGIPAGGVGEIVFTKIGARRSEAARGFDDRSIPHGTEVVITAYERGIAVVEPWHEVLGQSGPPRPASRSAAELEGGAR